MGGHAGGEVASGKAISSASEILMRDYLSHILAPDAPFDAQHAQDALRRAVLYANEAVRSAGQSLGNDMGTTITMVLVVGDRAMIANVGDSRTYIYRDGKLRRISKDHSLVMRLVELGQIAEEDIYIHPQRNAVLRSLGDQPDIEVDCFEERLAPGDALLLCSDGQWEMTHDPEMEQILERFADVDAQHACQELISAANQAGGEDNVTSILVRFEAV
jgi:protein phosphatase